ncbi:hypothetical protein J6590_044616 [Homalodisca vitripennis]|nr:hypothetical protein J6590_044616 [Homalodisca vitripennis]
MDVPQMSVVPEILLVTSASPAKSPGEEATMSLCAMMDVPQMSVVPEILVVTSDSPAESPGEEATMSLCAM